MDFDFKNKKDMFLRVIWCSEHDSELGFFISYHLGKIMSTFTMIKQGGTKGTFSWKFFVAYYSSFNAARREKSNGTIFIE